ncbi:unnamed protein product, partial [Closterium sp. NIES-54]
MGFLVKNQPAADVSGGAVRYVVVCCGAPWLSVVVSFQRTEEPAADVVLFSAVCCGAVVVLCGALWCSVVLCGALWCSVVLCGALWCSVVLCGALWCS